MKVLLAPVGSRGDVQPMLALALALQARGHTTTLVVPPGAERLAAAHGLDAVASGSDIEAMVRRHAADLHRPWRVFRVLTEGCRREISAQIAEMEHWIPGHDVVVGAGLQLAASSIAAALGVPFRAVAYTPCIFPSPAHAPFWLPWRGGPSTLHRWLHWTVDVTVARTMLGPLHAYRRAHRLPAIDQPVQAMMGELPLLACDPDVAALPPDLRGRVEQVGWLAPGAGGAALAPDLEAWLTAGGAPIQIGFGSMIDRAPAQTVATCEALAERTGQRVLLLRGWSDHPTSDHPAVLVIDGAPHASLLPRCAMAIHHGGSGTSHAVAAAGLPQVVVPHLFDQYDFAHRLAATGLAAAPLARDDVRPPAAWMRRGVHAKGDLKRSGGTAPPRGAARHRGFEALAARVAWAQRPEVAARCQQVGAQIRSRDGVKAAVEALEAQVEAYRRGSWRAPALPTTPPWLPWPRVLELS